MSEPYQKELIRKNLSERTYQKELCLLFAFFFFHRANVQKGLIPPPPVGFRSLFKDLPPPP